MDRFSYTFMFVPRSGEQGAFVFYITKTTWRGNDCIKSETMAERTVRGIPEIADPGQYLANSMHMADLAYQLTTDEYAKSKRTLNGEINARPSSASGN